MWLEIELRNITEMLIEPNLLKKRLNCSGRVNAEAGGSYSQRGGCWEAGEQLIADWESVDSRIESGYCHR